MCTNRLIELPSNTDGRGALVYSEWRHLPFEPRRVFWIYDVQKDKTRGGHAHATCQEAVFAVSGSFDIWIDDGSGRETYHVSTPNVGVHVGAGVWCELYNFAPGTVCVVLASTDYEPNGYINDYAEFKKIYSK